MIMLDSYYRTIEGLEVLIEKEWCSFGHKFSHRISLGEDKHSDAERSPVFLQFLDALFQLINQFPIAFEYNSRFLVAIMDEVYSCRAGTFLYNTEQHRTTAKLKETTKSAWSILSADIERYTNPNYNPKSNNQVLVPNCSLRCIKLWKDYYLRHNVFVAPSNQEEEDTVTRQLLALKRALLTEYEFLVEQQNQAAQHSGSGSPAVASSSPVTQTTLV